MSNWPKDQLLHHPPELPMAERVRRYQHNIRAIRASGCKVPTIAMPDTLNPKKIEAWFIEKEVTIARLRNLIARVAKLPADTMIPVSVLEG